MENIIEPKILKGTRDFLPDEMSKRNFVEREIIKVFQLFGYDEIDTPAIEYAETLLGKYGEEGSKQLYRFKDNGKRDIALRFDQTIPTARLVASNYDKLPMPFKRYQISKVWRAEKPAKGRYREFTQCDIDIIGTENTLSDAEVAKVIYKVFRNLGINDFVIKINSRKLINSILESLKISNDLQTPIIRILDKLDKIGKEGVEKELEKVITDKKIVDEIIKITIQSGSNKEKVEKLSKYDVKQIKELLSLSTEIPEKYLEFEPSLARGLDYYTGIIYEVCVNDVKTAPVCAGGGRYDNLCGLFSSKKLSGVGVAFGFDRIVNVMEEKGLFKKVTLNSAVMVTYFDNETLKQSLNVLNSLQNAGINSEIYFQPEKLSKQFKYANKKQIKFVVICGTDEVEDGTITIKNMENGKQKTIPEEQLVDYFNGYTNI